MLIPLLAACALGATLHVRSHAPLGGDGSEARPFASIAQALAHAGTAIALEPGLYEEALVISEPVEISGDGQAVIAAPPGSAVAIDARADLKLHGLSIQGGRVGLRVHARATLEHVKMRGQPDAALACVAGADCTLRGVLVESSFAQASGVTGAGALHLSGVELAGPFRRALDVTGTVDGSELYVHGAVTGLQAADARVHLRDAHFEDLRGTCVFGARGSLELVEPVISGCEVAIEVREGERVAIRGGEIARCSRLALSATEAEIDARDLVIIGPSRDGAVMISGGSLSLADCFLRRPGENGIAARLARILLVELVVDGAETDRQGDFGDGLFLYDSHLSGQGLLARHCQGAAIEAQLGDGNLADVEVESGGQAAVALEHQARLRLDGLSVWSGSGTGLACIEHSRARVRAPSFGKLPGGRWLVGCDCDVAVQPPDPALTACQTPPKAGENPR